MCPPNVPRPRVSRPSRQGPRCPRRTARTPACGSSASHRASPWRPRTPVAVRSTYAPPAARVATQSAPPALCPAWRCAALSTARDPHLRGSAAPSRADRPRAAACHPDHEFHAASRRTTRARNLAPTSRPPSSASSATACGQSSARPPPPASTHWSVPATRRRSAEARVLTRAAAAHTPARANAAPRQQHLASHHPTCKSINQQMQHWYGEHGHPHAPVCGELVEP